ncbi:MAG: YbjN domain-containing protein, partial [Pseudomonadota bacterium]
LMFFAEFELGRDETPGDYRIVNGFNDQQVFGRAFVLPKVDKVGVDYVIELGGGVSEKHLTENVGRWADVLAEFLTTFQAGEPIG